MIVIEKDNSGVTYQAVVRLCQEDGYEELVFGDGWDKPEDVLEFYAKMARALGFKDVSNLPYEVIS
jgi:hypothetical protein